MTVDRLAPGARERDAGVLSAATILAICDRLLDEVGRRQHMFAWLRSPGAGAGAGASAGSGDWLAVDAYYPRARLVVICPAGRGPHDALFRELIPAHGLGLLMLDPAALGGDPAAARAAVAAKLFDLEHVPGRRPSSEPPAAAWTPVKVGRAPVTPALEQGAGVLVGLALAAVLIAEAYLDVAHVFGVGHVVLGFAVALEACSRAIGTVSAARSGAPGWACACAIIGAPAVAWFAFVRRSDGREVETTPLAGLLAGLAALLAIVGLLVGG